MKSFLNTTPCSVFPKAYLFVKNGITRRTLSEAQNADSCIAPDAKAMVFPTKSKKGICRYEITGFISQLTELRPLLLLVTNDLKNGSKGRTGVPPI